MAKFFEDFGERVAHTAETVSEKAENIVEITRLKNLIRSLGQANRKDLKALGDFVYEQYRNKEKLPKKYAELCEAVEEREKCIEKYHDKIAGLKKDRPCPTCGRYSPKDNSFCPFCGTKLDGEDREKPADLKEKVTEAAKAAKEKAEDMAEKVKEKAGDFAEKAEDFMEKAKEKAGDMAEKVKEKAEDFVDKVKEDDKEDEED